MSRSGRIALELVGGCFAAIALVAVALVLRLASGPVPLDLVAPYLAAALSNPALGINVTIDHASLALDTGPQLELVAHGVRLRTGMGGAQVTLPDLAADFSLKAALRGAIAPTRIVVNRPRLLLVRDKAGAFHLGLAADASTAAANFGQWLAYLGRPPNPSAPLGLLREVMVRDAAFVFDDVALGVRWRAGAEMVLRRDGSGVIANAALAVVGGTAPSRLVASVRYRRDDARLEAKLTFNGIVPAAWAATAPSLAPLAALDMPIDGTVRATLDPARVAILAASCDVRFGAGSLREVSLPGGAVAIDGGTLIGSYDPARGRIVIDHATLGLGGPGIMASGTIDGVGSSLLVGGWPHALDVALALEASDVPAASLPPLWPMQLAPRTRRWVLSHVSTGVVDRAAVALELHVALGAVPTFSVQALSGTAAYHGGSIAGVGKLPPVTGIDGTARFDRKSAVLTPKAASLPGLVLSDMRIVFEDLGEAAPQVRGNATLAGPLKEGLALVAAAPGQALLPRAPSLRDMAGRFTATVGIAAPLTPPPDRSPAEISVAAKLSDVAVPKAVFGRDVSDGTFTLMLAHGKFTLAGKAALAGVPMMLTLSQSHGLGVRAPLKARLDTTLDDADRRALGLDPIPDLVRGPVAVDASYDGVAGGSGTAQLVLDLGQARVTLPPLGWAKPARTPAIATLALTLHGRRLAAIRRVTVAGGGLRLQASVGFPASGPEIPSRIAITRLAVGATDLRGTILRRAAGGWRIDIPGKSLDATALIKLLERLHRPEPPFELTANLDRLVLGPGREARHVSVAMVGNGQHWQTASIDATLRSGAALRLRFGEVAGARRFELHTDDMGGLVSLLGLSDNITGGRLQLTGNAVDDRGTRRLVLTAEGADYRLVHAPLLAQLLSLASFSGIGAMLSGDGIPFSRLGADLVIDENHIRIDHFRTYGGAIGITADGAVDRHANTLDFSGTLVPAYTLNAVLGNIPVIGNLLLGGAGQGIFGANYRVAGPIAAPGVSLNPLSALAPGVLRKLFLFAPGNPAG